MCVAGPSRVGAWCQFCESRDWASAAVIPVVELYLHLEVFYLTRRLTKSARTAGAAGPQAQQPSRARDGIATEQPVLPDGIGLVSLLGIQMI